MARAMGCETAVRLEALKREGDRQRDAMVARGATAPGKPKGPKKIPSFGPVGPAHLKACGMK